MVKTANQYLSGGGVKNSLFNGNRSKYKINNYLKLMRIKHWLKNGLIFLPLIFSSQILNLSKLSIAFAGFFSFCFIASSVYIINDLKDVEKDKKHPVKKNRPLASGNVNKKEAIILMLILIIFSSLINIFYVENVYSLLFLLLYLILNIGYSFGLKNIPIIDVIILVSGFVLRVIYGACIVNVEISKWLYLTVMSGSFFMGFGKRRNEIIKQGNESREVLKYYTKEFLDKFMYVSLILTIMFYSLWSIDSYTILRFGNEFIVYTIPLILIIFMRYCLDVEGDSFGDPVDVLTSDKLLMAMVLLFIIAIFVIVYVI